MENRWRSCKRTHRKQTILGLQINSAWLGILLLVTFSKANLSLAGNQVEVKGPLLNIKSKIEAVKQRFPELIPTNYMTAKYRKITFPAENSDPSSPAARPLFLMNTQARNFIIGEHTHGSAIAVQLFPWKDKTIDVAKPLNRPIVFLYYYALMDTNVAVPYHVENRSAPKIIVKLSGILPESPASIYNSSLIVAKNNEELPLSDTSSLEGATSSMDRNTHIRTMMNAFPSNDKASPDSNPIPSLGDALRQLLEHADTTLSKLSNTASSEILFKSLSRREFLKEQLPDFLLTDLEHPLQPRR